MTLWEAGEHILTRGGNKCGSVYETDGQLYIVKNSRFCHCVGAEHGIDIEWRALKHKRQAQLVLRFYWQGNERNHTDRSSVSVFLIAFCWTEMNREGLFCYKIYWGGAWASNIFLRPSMPDMASTFFLQSLTSAVFSWTRHSQLGGGILFLFFCIAILVHWPSPCLPFWPTWGWLADPWTLCAWSPTASGGWRRPRPSPAEGWVAWTSLVGPQPWCSGLWSKPHGRRTVNKRIPIDNVCVAFTSLVLCMTLASMSYRSSSTTSILECSSSHSFYKDITRISLPEYTNGNFRVFFISSGFLLSHKGIQQVCATTQNFHEHQFSSLNLGGAWRQNLLTLCKTWTLVLTS